MNKSTVLKSLKQSQKSDLIWNKEKSVMTSSAVAKNKRGKSAVVKRYSGYGQ